MQRKEDKQKPAESLLAAYKNSIWLGIQKAVAVLPTQPLQVIMRLQQSSLVRENEKLTAIQAIRKINAGSKASIFSKDSPYFRGSSGAMLKEFLKNAAYKGVIAMYAPQGAELVLSPFSSYMSPAQYTVLSALTSGTFAAAGDTIIGGIPESYATFRATSQGKYANASFLKEVMSQGSFHESVARAYQGAVPTFLKGFVAFNAMYLAGTPVKRFVVDQYDVTDSSKLPWHGRLLSSTLVGTVVAGASSTLDIVKTQAQMPNPSKAGVLTAIKNNIKQHGIRSLGAGLPIKILMTSLGWALTFEATQKGQVVESTQKMSVKNG